MSAGQTSPAAWRIAYIPHTAFGGKGYVRVYGWGYLSWPGILAAIVGTAGLAFAKASPWWLPLVFGGFALTFAGAILNGLSERRSMQQVLAQCLDVEIRHLSGIHHHRSAGWAVRAHMRYRLGTQQYESTPGQQGYDFLGSQAAAEAFAGYLKNAGAVPLHVDPGHPTRTLFVRLKAPEPVVQRN